MTYEPSELILEELQTSRRVRKDVAGNVTYDFEFIVIGTLSERTVRCRVENPTTGIYQQWRNNQNYAGCFLIGYELEHIGNGAWYVKASCGQGGRSSAPNSGHDVSPPSTLAFTSTGSSKTVKQALTQTAIGSSAPDVQLAVNVANDDVKGVSVLEPVFRFTEVWSFPWNEIFVDGIATPPGDLPIVPGTESQPAVRNWLDAWQYCVGKINVGDFRNWTAQEVLCRSINGRDVGDWQMEVTFEFEVRETTLVDIPDTVEGGPTELTLKGWQYLWYIYEKQPLGTGSDKRTAMQPKYGYVADIYKTADFAMLGIGQVDDCFYVSPSTGAILKPLDVCEVNPTDPTGQGDDWEVNDHRVNHPISCISIP